MTESNDAPTESGPNQAATDPTPTVRQPEMAAFEARLRLPPFWRIAVVALAGLILLVSAALTFGASPSPSPSSNDDGNGDGWLPGPAFLDGAGPLSLNPARGLDRGMRLGRFGGVTITAIDGSNLSLRTDDGWTRTIAVTSSTTITKGGQTIALGDLEVSDTIGFSQTRKDDGTYTIDAIAVLIPQVAGEVTEITSNGFTLKTRDGTSWTITVNGSTAYKLGSADGSKSDVKVGTDIVVSGEKGSTDTSLTALTVHVRVPVVFGEVTAKTGSTITIERRDGTSQTIHVGGATTYKVRGTDDASLSDITVGMAIVVQGSQRSDGSIDASTVAAGGLNRGLKGFGPGFWPGSGLPNDREPAPSASPDGSSTQG
jgi:hypothetical protein